ncbi:MAG: PDZ domain-containing protein [Bdellovibrionaceae bacterium]|nr:PDZ domain-containing protein [Bdellovibrio sp.]
MKLGKFNLKQSNKISKIALYALLTFIAFTIADLTIIHFRDRMIPTEAPPKKNVKFMPPPYVDRSQFNTITNRNLFSSTGVMPEAITARKDSSQPGENADPIPSQLPLNLIGTMVHSNPAKSIVAVEVKSKNISGSYSTGADIEGLARVEKIERNIVFIRNNNTGALEYLELNKAGNKVSFDASKAAAPSAAKGNDVISTGNNVFQIKRSDLLKYTNDLSSVLMQARAVPNKDPNTGEINGFRILDMQPGSIYEQLGLKPMDVLKGVNGEPIDSVQKAMEMYNTLKNGNQVKLQVERAGKNDTFTYDVK